MIGPTKDTAKRQLMFVVTTSLRPTFGLVEKAKQLAARFNVTFAARGELSIRDLSGLFSADGVLVVSSQKISFLMGENKFFFHPALAGLRIKKINTGKTDQMINAMSLKEGNSVLDCTMGLGTDAIVASYVTGATGSVTGLECSPVISELVKQGLQSYMEKDRETMLAMRRIKVINTKHKEYLASLKTGSYDIVYFDPMFRYPRRKSPGINAARMLANHEPIDREIIEMAFNAAVRRVVMKERRDSAEFARLGFKYILGGRYSPVAYGVRERQWAPE
ncbi:MAG: class I SAM-dependent methyltransferase [Desulfotomaculaceae bacterium]|nr:class I SAM-dependent methyltransferase [Desulfotomaculaceae bacterium]